MIKKTKNKNKNKIKNAVKKNGIGSHALKLPENCPYVNQKDYQAFHQSYKYLIKRVFHNGSRRKGTSFFLHLFHKISFNLLILSKIL